MRKRKKCINNLYARRSIVYSLLFSVFIWSVLGCGRIADGTNEQTIKSENVGMEQSVSEEVLNQESEQMSADASGELWVQDREGTIEGDFQAQEDMSSGENAVSSGNIVSGQGAKVPDGNASTGQGAKTPDGNVGTGQGAKVPDGNTGTGQGAKAPYGNAGTGQGVSGGSTVMAQGALSVDGTQLVDASGNPVQIRGISTHGLAWYPDYVNEDCFRQLKEEWGVNVVRLAMYTAEYGGYCTGGDQDALKELVRSGVEYAVECGLYVIIDWHILSDGNPNTYLMQAKDFFAEMSDIYKDYTNVLYEICNEPNGGTSWNEIKQYAEEIIEVIRENDKDGIILVGTPNWSQYVDQAAADPIAGYDNIMYTLHYYAATHTETLRNTMVRAVEDGLPIFVSEYGICDASGNGAIDEFQANQWVDILDEYKISYVAWNLSNKSETSAVIKSSCSKVKGFTTEDLSDSGKWLYNMLRSQGSVSEANSFAGAEENRTSGEAVGSHTNVQGSGQGNSAGDGMNVQGGGQGNSAGSGMDVQGGEQGNAAGNLPGIQDEQENAAGGNGTSNGAAGCSIAADVINSWGQGNETYYQYTLTLTNDSEADLNGWTLSISFSDDIVLSGGWNGNYQVNGNVLTISAMDYNGYVAAGGSVENIGFILYGTDTLTILEATEL